MSPFTPRVPPSDIRRYVQELGYSTSEILSTDGRPVGFDIEGTTLRVGYNSERDGRITSYGAVALMAATHLLEPPAQEQNRKLYRRLYQRFHRRASDPNLFASTSEADQPTAEQEPSPGLARILAALADPDPQQRRWAARVLGAIPERWAVPALVSALDDPDPQVRNEVRKALGNLWLPNPEQFRRRPTTEK